MSGSVEARTRHAVSGLLGVESLASGAVAGPARLGHALTQFSPRVGQYARSLAGGVFLVIAAGCSERPQPAADPDAMFRAQMGRQWELARLGTRDIPSPPPGTPADSPGVDLVPGRRPTIAFTADPLTLGGRSFCNGYGGPFTIYGDSLRIFQIMSSAVGCDSADSLETRFFRGLRETRRFELHADSLVFITMDGSRLMFVPAPAPAAGPRTP